MKNFLNKKWRSILLAVLLLAMLTSVVAIASACHRNGGEDEQETYATLTLNAGEYGTLSTTQYEVKVGTVLSQYLSNIAPTPNAGLIFGGWFEGDNLLSDSRKMPENGLTLNARYKATYTVEVYVQNVDDDNYTKVDAMGITDTAFIGETATVPAQAPKHYKIADNANAVKEVVVSTSDNVLKWYLDREVYDIYYIANLDPSDYEGDVKTESARYGAKLTLVDNMFTANMYRFAGWEISNTDTNLHMPNDEFVVEDTTFIRAIWDKAYTDRNGGLDLIFATSHGENKAYLRRFGMDEQEGVYDETTRMFYFNRADNKQLKGRTASDGMFAYYEETAVPFYRYDIFTDKIVQDDVLELDFYYTATMTVNGKTVTGTYTAVDGGYQLVATNGKEYFFMVDEISVEASDGVTLVNYDVFVLRGEEYGYYVSYDEDNYVMIMLDGFGSALAIDVLDESSPVMIGTYDFVSENEVFLDLSALGLGVLPQSYTCKIVLPTQVIEGLPFGYYEVRNDSAFGTFNGENGSTLVFDGYGKVTYTVGGSTMKGECLSNGVYLARAELSGQEYTFFLNRGNNTFLVVSNDAAEYRIYEPTERRVMERFLYLDGTGNAIFFDYDSVSGYIERASGTVAAVNGSDWEYKFTDNNSYGTYSFTFYYDTRSGISCIVRQASSTYYKDAEYTGADDTKIEHNKYGDAVYTDANGKEHKGTYFYYGYPQYYYVFTCNEHGEELVYTVDAWNNTFSLYDNSSSSDTLPNGTYYLSPARDKSYCIYVSYYTTEVDLGYSAIVKGTITSLGNGVYQFTMTQLVDPSAPEDLRNFVFKVFEEGVSKYFTLKNEALEGEFEVEDGGTLVLDGFASGSYTTADGTTYKGTFKVNNDSIVLTTANRTFFFDKKDDVFTVRGKEFGTTSNADGIWTLNGGSVSKSPALKFDGYNKAWYYSQSMFSDPISGTYTIDRDTMTGEFNSDDESVTIQFRLVTDDGVNAYIAYVEEQDGEFYVTDWSLFSLDGYNAAVYIDERGVAHLGFYTVDGTKLTITTSDDIVFTFIVNWAAHTARRIGNESGTYNNNGNKLILDGTGNATYLVGETSEMGSYTFNEKTGEGEFNGSDTQFRFRLSGSTYEIYNAELSGRFKDKFGSGAFLTLDGYGYATYQKGYDVQSGELSIEGDIVTITLPTYVTLKFRIDRSAKTFVKYDSSMARDRTLYDTANDATDSTKILRHDGYDGVTFLESGSVVATGKVVAVKGNSYTIALDGGGETVVKFEYINWTNCYLVYDATTYLSLTNGSDTLELDGFGTATYSTASGTVLTGKYSVSETVIILTTDDYAMAQVMYFKYNRAALTFTVYNDEWIIDGNTLLKYNGSATDVKVPDEVTVIGAKAFYYESNGDTLLTSINLNNVTTICSDAFYGQSNLATIIATKVQTLEAYAFRGCTGIVNLELPAIETIGESAFYGCSNLANVKVGESIETIGSTAFWSAKATITVEFEGYTAPQMGSEVFRGANSYVVLVQDIQIALAFFAEDSWAEYVSHISVVGEVEETTLYSVTTLRKVVFGKTVTIDGIEWLVEICDNNVVKLYAYDAEETTHYRMLNGQYTSNGAITEMTFDGLKFVVADTQLTYTANDETLVVTVTDSNKLSATFNSQAIEIDVTNLSFTLDEVTYKLTLNANGTFSYTQFTGPSLVGTYTADDDSTVTIYSTESGYEMHGTVTVDGTAISGGTINRNGGAIWTDAKKVSDNVYSVLVPVKNSYGNPSGRYRVTITVNGSSFTYTSVQEQWANTAAPASGSSIGGRLIIYRETSSSSSAILDFAYQLEIQVPGSYLSDYETIETKCVKQSDTVFILTIYGETGREEIDSIAGEYTITVNVGTYITMYMVTKNA